MTLFRHEMKMNLKSLLIWTICVGGLCFGCILLYTSLEDSLQDIADVYSNMGAMSTALGMDKMSLATLTGFYATEIGMMHGLGGAMFAAILGAGIVSKEEAGHTAEFLYVFPVKRTKILWQKYLAMASNILLFNIICAAFYVLGFLLMKEDMQGKEMLLYHFAQAFMHLEIGTVCFLISVFSKRSLIGAGLGVPVILFAADLMCRIIPAIEKVKYVTPFYYANAADIFTSGKVELEMICIGVFIVVAAFIMAWIKFIRKDITA
ncbi:MAG: ABC transporter permease subunit [Lachnospiraceae bacterium]|nr:ABC transporter permease subunit [Lachnospiraceae bacterium]